MLWRRDILIFSLFLNSFTILLRNEWAILLALFVVFLRCKVLFRAHLVVDLQTFQMNRENKKMSAYRCSYKTKLENINRKCKHTIFWTNDQGEWWKCSYNKYFRKCIVFAVYYTTVKIWFLINSSWVFSPASHSFMFFEWL